MYVLLADNQSRVRSALRLLLEQQLESCEIEEVDSLQNILTSIGNKCPDVLLLDWKFLGITPAKTLGDIQASCPGLFIVAMDSNPQTAQAARKAGASSFVSKNDPPERLLAAINGSRDSEETTARKQRAYNKADIE